MCSYQRKYKDIFYPLGEDLAALGMLINDDKHTAKSWKRTFVIQLSLLFIMTGLVLSIHTVASAMTCQALFPQTTSTIGKSIKNIITRRSIRKLKNTKPQQPSFGQIAKDYIKGKYLPENISLETFDARSIKYSFDKIIYSRDNGIINKGLFQRKIAGKKYFVKMFYKHLWKVNEGSLNNHGLAGKNGDLTYLITPELIRNEISYAKLLSDLGWGPKIYGVLVHNGHIVGYISEQVPGRLARNLWDYQYGDTENHPGMLLAEKRRRTLEKIGIYFNDFQYMYDEETEGNWIIDTTGTSSGSTFLRHSADELEELFNEAHQL